MDSWTRELCVSQAQSSKTFHKALIVTTESLAFSAHADGQH